MNAHEREQERELNAKAPSRKEKSRIEKELKRLGGANGEGIDRHSLRNRKSTHPLVISASLFLVLR
jgi:hypothetical protein